jgi:hypothetical protein
MNARTNISLTPFGCLRPIGRFTLAALACLALAGPASAQSYTLNNTWSLAGAIDNLDTANDNRGICYDAAGSQVLVNNKGTHVIAAYDATTGNANNAVNMTGVSGGNFTINKLGFGTDGILYGANLNTTVSGSSSYKIYSWTNQASAPYNCYATASSDALGAFTAAGSKRLGDTFAITGGGLNTLIMAGMYTNNAFALFYTTDGVNFTPTILNVPLPAPNGGVQFGLAFYTNNTFIVAANAPGGGTTVNMYLVQFPSAYKTLTGPLTCTVLATNQNVAGNFLDIAYNATAGLLAAHANAATTGSPSEFLYYLPATDFSAIMLLSSTDLSFSTSSSINGNEVGDIALGGQGLTNMIYTLDTSAGLQATAIIFSSAPVPPVITGQPVGGTVYTSLGSFPLTVSASGITTLSYAWQFNTENNLDTATNIPGATNATLTLSPLTTNDTGWYDVIVSNAGGSVASAAVNVSVYAPATNTEVTQLWSLPPGSSQYPFIDSSDYDNLGLAYDPKTMTLLVANSSSDVGIYVLDANTRSNLFTMNTAGIGVAGNIEPLNQIGVADDGVLYAGNVSPAGSAVFQLVSWSSVSSSASPYQAYLGDPGNGSGDRWGDEMSVRGAGTNTQILLGSFSRYESGPGEDAALLTTTDGQNFQSTTLVITNANGIPAGFARLGIAFGAGNTFWTKSTSFNLYQIGFDPVTGNCTILQTFTGPQNGTGDWWGMSGIGVDANLNILGGIGFDDVPNDLELFQLSATAAPNLFEQAFFPSLNGNIQNNGVTIIKYPRIYSMDANNGIIALSLNLPVWLQAPVSVTNYVGMSAMFSAVAAVAEPVSYQWQHNGTNLTGQTSGTLTLSPLTPAMAGVYTFAAINATSTNTASATLTVLPTPTAIDVSSGLVLHLKFDGDFLDYSGRGNNGTMVGNVAFVPDGVVGQAARFTNDYDTSDFNYVTLGVLPDLEFSSNVDFSVSYWVREPAGELSGDVPFIGNAVGAGDSPGYFFGPAYLTGGWRWSLLDASGTPGIVYPGANNSINDGNWHNVISTFSRTNNSLTFLDGQLVANVPISIAAVGNLDTGEPTVVGQDPTGQYDDGADDSVVFDLDDMAVWRRALTPLEATGIYMAAASNHVSFVSARTSNLQAQLVAGQVQLTWSGGLLQVASQVNGPYTTVAGANSPYPVVSTTIKQQFYRIKQ